MHAHWSEPQCGGVIEIGIFDDITIYGKSVNVAVDQFDQK